MKLVQKFAVAYIRIKFRVLSSVSKKKTAEKAFELFCTPQFRNVNKLPAIFEEAEKLRFSFEQYTIAGYRWNKEGNRKVMIVHGFESSVISFGQYIKPLIKKGYEVLAFDAPAHGRSSGKKVNVVIYRDLIKYVHEKYGPVQSFMAHSFGGLALSLALPEIKHDDSYRVVLVAPATETSTALDQFFKFIRVDDKIIRKEFEDIIVSMSGHSPSWFSIHRVIAEIRAKILWLHDEDDPVTPLKDAQRIKNENHPNIQFVITKGLGHRKIYRDAEVGRTIVDFI